MMTCRGVHFALTADQEAALLEADSEEEGLELLEAIEEEWDEAWLAESDKAWDPMHRSLTDGDLQWNNGEYPLSHCVLGGLLLYQGDGCECAILKTPEEVRNVAEALGTIDQAALRAGYDRINAVDYEFEKDDEDFDYTWHWFGKVRDLYLKAAEANRAMLFFVQ